MSVSDQRRKEQAEFWHAMEQLAQERPIEPPVLSVENPRSWASTCAGVVHGTHERTKESRLAGVYKCKWCAQTFDPPSSVELEAQLRQATAYIRPQRVRRGRW
jgi:hypothetical protein